MQSLKSESFKLTFTVGYETNELEPRWAGEESVYYQYAIITESYCIENIDTSSTAVVTIHSNESFPLFIRMNLIILCIDLKSHECFNFKLKLNFFSCETPIDGHP